MTSFAESELATTQSKPRILRGRITLSFVRFAVVLAIIAAITWICNRLIPVNATTAGFAYLIAVLGVATVWGLPEALIALFPAVFCFNFFFFPPVGTFHISDPQNWVALSAFLVAAITASQLSARAKQRTQEAVAQRLEMERLYALSRSLLLTDPKDEAAPQIARQIAQIFDCRAVALYDHKAGTIYRAGPADIPTVEDKLKQAAQDGTVFADELAAITVTSIRLGGQPVGSLALQGTALTDAALQALANLVAISLEKERSQQIATRAEAARQSEELKSTLLDAIAHEFKTPLTSIKAAASALLLAPPAGADAQHELLTVVNEEVDRLDHLITDAIHMARIEAGKLELSKEAHSLKPLVARVLQQMHAFTESRTINAHIPPDLPQIVVDAELVALAIKHLIDNALKFSPPDSPVSLTASGTENEVVLTVADCGPGIPAADWSRVFEKFYRGSNIRARVPGTGMGLAIAREIVRAHGGDIWIKQSSTQGSELCLSLPVAKLEQNL